MIGSLGLGGAILAANGSRSPAQNQSTPSTERIANELHEAIRGFQLDDTHCHVATGAYAQLTSREFLLATSLAAMPRASVFSAGCTAAMANRGAR